MRKEFSKAIKVAAFKRACGHCEDCRAFLAPGKFEYDHDLADGLGGEPTLENCVVRCHSCHGKKTTTHDVPMIAKANRIRAKHIGAKSPSKNPVPGSKNTPFKKKFNGTTVRRDA